MTLPWRSFKRYTPGRGGTAVRRSSSARASGGTATLTAGGATWFSAVTMTDYSDTRRDLTMGGRVRRAKRLGPARAGRATRAPSGPYSAATTRAGRLAPAGAGD